MESCSNQYSVAKKQSSIKKQCPFIHSGVLFKKEAVLSNGGYHPFAHSFEDHLLWMQLSGKGKFFNFSEPLIKVRLSPSSMTIDEKWRPRQFHNIKKSALQKQTISEADSESLKRILELQDTVQVKEGAYHCLLAKKFLWNNHQPAKARCNLRKAMSKKWFHWETYGLYLISFLPASWLRNSYVFLKQDLIHNRPFKKQGHAG